MVFNDNKLFTFGESTTTPHSVLNGLSLIIVIETIDNKMSILDIRHILTWYNSPFIGHCDISGVSLTGYRLGLYFVVRARSVKILSVISRSDIMLASKL